MNPGARTEGILGFTLVSAFNKIQKHKYMHIYLLTEALFITALSASLTNAALVYNQKVVTHVHESLIEVSSF